MLELKKDGEVIKSELVLSGSAGERVSLYLDGETASLLRSRQTRSFFKVKAKERLLLLVERAGKTEQLEEISRKYYLCDCCDLEGVNLYGARKIFEVIIEVLYKYPMLRSHLCYIGSYRGYQSCVDRLCDGDAGVLKRFGMQYLCDAKIARELGKLTRQELERSCFRDREGVAMALSAFGFFDAVIINDKSFEGYGYIKTANDIRYSERIGFHPKGCDKMESVVYHEIGHVLDYMCRVSESEIFSSFYNKLSEEEIKAELSEYALSSMQEFIAEAVSEWFCSQNPRKLSVQTVKILDQAYHMREKI